MAGGAFIQMDKTLSLSDALWGNTENSVFPNLCTVIVYCLVAIIEQDCELKRSTFNVLRVIGRVLLAKASIPRPLQLH